LQNVTQFLIRNAPKNRREDGLKAAMETLNDRFVSRIGICGDATKEIG
jgi:hypothetical protein